MSNVWIVSTFEPWHDGIISLYSWLIIYLINHPTKNTKFGKRIDQDVCDTKTMSNGWWFYNPFKIGKNWIS